MPLCVLVVDSTPYTGCSPPALDEGFDAAQEGGRKRLKRSNWFDCFDENEIVIASIMIAVLRIVGVD